MLVIDIGTERAENRVAYLDYLLVAGLHQPLEVGDRLHLVRLDFLAVALDYYPVKPEADIVIRWGACGLNGCLCWLSLDALSLRLLHEQQWYRRSHASIYRCQS